MSQSESSKWFFTFVIICILFPVLVKYGLLWLFWFTFNFFCFFCLSFFPAAFLIHKYGKKDFGKYMDWAWPVILFCSFIFACSTPSYHNNITEVQNPMFGKISADNLKLTKYKVKPKLFNIWMLGTTGTGKTTTVGYLLNDTSIKGYAGFQHDTKEVKAYEGVFNLKFKGKANSIPHYVQIMDTRGILDVKYELPDLYNELYDKSHDFLLNDRAVVVMKKGRMHKQELRLIKDVYSLTRGEFMMLLTDCFEDSPKEFVDYMLKKHNMKFNPKYVMCFNNFRITKEEVDTFRVNFFQRIIHTNSMRISDLKKSLSFGRANIWPIEFQFHSFGLKYLLRSSVVGDFILLINMLSNVLVLFPLVVIMLKKFGKEGFGLMTIIVVMISLVLSMGDVRHHAVINKNYVESSTIDKSLHLETLNVVEGHVHISNVWLLGGTGTGKTTSIGYIINDLSIKGKAGFDHDTKKVTLYDALMTQKYGNKKPITHLSRFMDTRGILDISYELKDLYSDLYESKVDLLRNDYAVVVIRDGERLHGEELKLLKDVSSLTNNNFMVLLTHCKGDRRVFMQYMQKEHHMTLQHVLCFNTYRVKDKEVEMFRKQFFTSLLNSTPMKIDQFNSNTLRVYLLQLQSTALSYLNIQISGTVLYWIDMLLIPILLYFFSESQYKQHIKEIRSIFNGR